MVFSRARSLAAAARGVHTSALVQQSLPALTVPAAKPSMFSAIFGAKANVMPPMDQPVPGLSIPEAPTAPATAPATKITVLSNGATIASEDTPGATAAVGIYVDSGSKFEDAATSGASHLLERMAFKATANRTTFRLTREAEVIGANLLASASREQMAYTVDCLKTNIPEAVELLSDAVLNPRLANHEVAAVAATLKAEIAALAENPQATIMEAVHATAYNGGIGQPLIATDAALKYVTGDVLRDFVANNYTAPRVVIAGAGVSHDELVSCAEPLLSGLPAGAGAAAAPSTYVGGDFRMKTDSPVTGAVIGFEFAGGWRDTKASTAVTVLTMLLGGGGSFSAGGPGKGMYSRLYTRVLNKYAWAQNCTAFHSIFNDTGIVGISAAADGAAIGEMIKVMAGEMTAVAKSGGVSDTELERAKAATVSSILMNLESKAVVAEDIGRQVLTYKERKSAADFIAEVKKVTAADIASVAGALIKSAPTVAIAGDLAAAPRYDAIKAMF